MPAPVPSRLRALSKYIIQCSGLSLGGGIWISVHYDTKSARIGDLITCRGQNSMLNSPSSTYHLTMLPLASRLRINSPTVKDEGTVILWAWK
jgi:hypothetical protein